MSEPVVLNLGTHHFNVNDACAYGTDSAIIISNLRFWILKNRANEKHYYDGRWWTYNSIRAFEQLFPYWSARQIQHILKKLTCNENNPKGILISGNYNKNQFDRTAWYAFADEFKFLGIDPEKDKKKFKDMRENLEETPLNKPVKTDKSTGQNCQMHLPNMSNGDDKNVKPIPDINPDNKQDINIYAAHIGSTSGEVDASVVEISKQFSIKTFNKNDIENIVNQWNEFAKKNNLSTVRFTNSDFKNKIKQRLKNPDFDFPAILQKISGSDFLLGKTERAGNHTNWRISLMFVVKNDNNFIKILNGEYDNSKPLPFPSDSLSPQFNKIDMLAIEFMAFVDKFKSSNTFLAFKKFITEKRKDKFSEKYFEIIETEWQSLSKLPQNEYNEKREKLLLKLSDLNKTNEAKNA